MAHFGSDLRLPSYVLRQWLRGLLRSLRIFLALAFEVLAGILLAVNAFWDALLIYAIWRCILFVQTSLRCSRESTRELKNNGDQKKFPASAKVALESVDALPKGTAIALHERRFPSFPTVRSFGAEAFGYGLDGISYSSATTSSGSSHWRMPASFQFSSSKELTTHARDSYLMSNCVFELSESTSALRCSIENITSPPTSPFQFAWLGIGETPFDAIQFPISRQICPSLHSASGVSPNCVTTDGLSQSNEARLNPIVINRLSMHDGVLDTGHQLIVVKDPACCVMGRVHMSCLAGILSISRLGGAVLTRNLNKRMPVTIISYNDEPFPPTAKRALLGSGTRRPARRTSASKENFVIHLQLHGCDGDKFQPLQIARILRAPPMHTGKLIEMVDSKEQACMSVSVAETLQKIDEENKPEKPVEQTWWDEDAVLLGAEDEDMYNGFEQWKSLPKCRSKSLFSVCKSAMTSLASSLSSKSTR